MAAGAARTGCPICGGANRVWSQLTLQTILISDHDIGQGP